MTEQSDTTTLTGAQFQRHAGTDPAKWAEAFVAAYVRDGMAEASATGHTEFIACWFRDFGEARVAEEVGRVTARLVPRQEE